MIEFERASLVVCENIGTLPLTLTRTGDLETLAFVAIEARDRTTRTNEDYIPSAAQQVQFDPGMECKRKIESFIGPGCRPRYSNK